MKQQSDGPGYLKAALVSLTVILLIPLPAAFYYAGWEWVLTGWSGVPKEFIVTYVLGMIVLLGAVAWVLLKDRFGTGK